MSQGNTASALKMVRVMQHLRQLRERIEAQTAEVFFWVASAKEGDIRMRELQERTGLSSAATTRNIAALGSIGSAAGAPGLELLEAYEDPENRSHKRVRLTRRGRQLMETIEREIGK